MISIGPTLDKRETANYSAYPPPTKNDPSGPQIPKLPNLRKNGEHTLQSPQNPGALCGLWLKSPIAFDKQWVRKFSYQWGIRR